MATAAVGAIERPLRQLDPDETERLRWPRERLVLDEVELGARGALPAEEIDEHLGAEAARRDTEAGVAERVRHPPLHGAAPEHAVARARVDGAAPHVAERHHPF